MTWIHAEVLKCINCLCRLRRVSRCIASSATAKVNVPDRPVGQICSIQKSSSGSTPQIKKLFVVSEMHLIFSTSFFFIRSYFPKMKQPGKGYRWLDDIQSDQSAQLHENTRASGRSIQGSSLCVQTKWIDDTCTCKYIIAYIYIYTVCKCTIVCIYCICTCKSICRKPL